MEKDIGRIKKNDNTEIIVRLDDFGGKPGVTIREFVTSERYTGFTKSGVKIPASDFKKFREMIDSVTEEHLKAEQAEGAAQGKQVREGRSLPKNQKTLKEEAEASNEANEEEEIEDY